MTRVLETVLTGRNLLSPVLASAGRDVVAFNSTVAGANEKAAASSAASARVQQASANTSATAASRAATASTVGAGTQSAAAEKIAASNVKASTSASASAQQQMRAHTKAAESASLSARVQETANRSLAASNGLLGTSLTPLTAGLGAVGLGLAYAGYRGMEFDSAMSQVQAASQATAGDMGKLRDAAVDAGARTQYSAVEAAQGITEMSKAGVSARDILAGGLTGALNLAAAGQISVAEAAETGATALSVFRLEGNQMSHVADLLAAGAGKAQGSVGDLSAALNQSALVANQTGLSIEDTAGALAMFASNGLIGSDAGTSFKAMLQALTPNSVAASKAMDAIGFSAYDAQGQFVGMESVAGQLKTGLAGLTEEQRNTTLETIFGSDAVRAASVLYSEGARGVEEWTGKVDDAGYAARQATQLNDNLRGDLEKLGGAFDSVMTTIGSGAQGPLREVVQMLTAIVNAGGDVLGFWNSLPGPVQVAILTLAGVAALKGPVSSAFETIALKALYMRDSVAGASIGMGGLKTAGAGLLGFFGGPWGLAITGATVGLSLLVSWLGSSDDATDDVVASQTNLAQALRETKGAIDDTVRAAAAKDLEDTGLLRWAEKLGVESSVLTDALLGVPGAVDQVNGAFDRYTQQNSRVVVSGRVASTVLNDQGQAAKDAKGSFLDLAGVQGETAASQERVTAATAETGAAMQDTTVLTEEATQALEDWLKELQKVGESFIDPLATYTGLLDEKTAAERAAAEETAASTESSKDSWKDYVKEASVSLDEYATKLEEQLTAQDNWRANIATITQRGGMEVGQILAGMGVEGAQIAAQMATAMPAEFERLKNDLIREAQGATAGLDQEMKVMAAVGAAGASATAWAISDQLGIGVGRVAEIAAQYGLNLAMGVDPLLAALGKPGTVGRIASAQSLARQRGLYDGGYTGDGDKYEPAGIVHRGEFVLTKEQTARLGIDRIEEFANRGYANGGFVTAADVPRPPSTAPYGPPISTAADATMQKGFDEVRAWLTANAGVAGSGAVTGQWMSLWNLVKGQIPQARINSTFRAGDPGYHGRNKAIDFGYGSGPGGAGSAGLASINRLLHDQVGRNLAELIYDGYGDDRPDLKNGKPLTYSATTRAEHHNHVHAAVADTGGVMASGTAHLNLSGRPERTLSPQQTEAFDRWMTAPAAMPGYGGAITVSAPPVNIQFIVDGQEFRGMAKAVVDGRLEDWYREKVYR